MGWFSKKEKKNEPKEIPLLPELPKLPDFPQIKDEEINEPFKSIHQLPSLPTNSFGEKFSQNAIKEAITGKKEGEEVFEADEFMPKEETRRMQKPLKKSKKFLETRKVKKIEPIFIRIDKFEEGLKIFEKTKEKILDIENMLKDIKKIKEEEERELELWENEMQIIKNRIEKVDRDIFSQIE